ncbi:hypothetical protein [Micromonospora matsumotoense]|nr:hypothetical protein [Micromonospora matsumotoense]
MIKVTMIRMMAVGLAGKDVDPQGPIKTTAADVSTTASNVR